MEVTKGYIRIRTSNIEKKPNNIEIISININNLVVIKYNQKYHSIKSTFTNTIRYIHLIF